MRSATIRKSEPASSTRASRSARRPAATSADTSASVATNPSCSPSSVNTGATRSSPHTSPLPACEQVFDAGVGMVAPHAHRVGLTRPDRRSASGHDLVDLLGGQQVRQLRPDQLDVGQDRGPAAVRVDDLALDVGAQHHERPGLGHRGEQLAHVVELATQLFGVGHVEAGTGVALEVALRVVERQRTVVQPPVLAVGPPDPRRELERLVVGDRQPDAGRPARSGRRDACARPTRRADRPLRARARRTRSWCGCRCAGSRCGR